MTRKEFSEKMVECRENEKCGKNELCRRAGFTFHQLQRLETAANNFSIDNVIQYLKAIDYGICLSHDNKKEFLFDSRENFSKYFKTLREHRGVSQRDLAASSGVSYAVITGIEGGNKNTAIDSLLLCFQELNCQITFKKIA